MRRVFKNRPFMRWARGIGLTDAALRGAVGEMTRGLIGADLGGGILKKRVALPGRGKRGGARTIVATNRGDLWIFLYGFAKNERDSITPGELAFAKQIAQDLLGHGSEGINRLLEARELEEI